jgi:hypothetical protein
MYRRAFALLLVAIGAALGCQSIAGIDDRTYDLGRKEPTPECRAYCEQVMTNCVTPHAAYASLDTCLGVCALLAPGDKDEPGQTNTLACRARQATLAGSSTAAEPAVYCPRAAPGGGGTCGSICESYCALLQSACPQEFATVPSCIEKCAALEDVRTFDVEANYGGDTLQCRLVHLSTATIDPAGHCSHSAVRPLAKCVDEDPPSCADYCRVVMVACKGSLAVYETAAQCESACRSFTAGTHSDQTGDTLGCRLYHSYSSLADPETHCAHAGPGGDGHCGSNNCPAYCAIAKSACSAAFDAKYATPAACDTDCRTLSGSAADSHYTVSQTPQTELGCRMLHAVRSFADASNCPSALGAGTCAR